MARNAMLANLQKAKDQAELKRQQWMREHPVSAGLIPVVDYIPPRGGYVA